MAEKLAVGVMGSASGTLQPEVVAACTCLGRVMAERGCTLITGDCPGLPYTAVQGAKAASGFVGHVCLQLTETAITSPQSA